MRRRHLVSSVRRLLRADERLAEVVLMWRFARWMVTAAAVAGLAAFALFTALSYGSPAARAGLAVAVALLVSVARTDYCVLALTSAPRLVLFRAGRVRQVAVAEIGEIPLDADIEVVSSNAVLSEWIVAGERYTVPKSSQAAMTRLAGE